MQKSNKKTKKKVGLLTFHFPQNIGAMLQAYALQQTINNFAKCEIVNYQPSAHAFQYGYNNFIGWRYKFLKSKYNTEGTVN